MKPDRRSRGRDARPFVDPLFAEALTHREEKRPRHSGRADHKTFQLCRQVQRALGLALAGECDDDVLRELYVDEVIPAPDASRLLVRVAVPARVEVSMIEVLGRLERVHGRLRQAVAQAITRKRAPELTFMPVLPATVPEVMP